MAERDKGAIAIPLDVVIDGAGNGHMHFVVGATDRQTAQELVDHMRQSLPGTFEDITDSGCDSCPPSSKFFFSSSRWKAPWEPEGPKKNWMGPPKNPSLN